MAWLKTERKKLKTQLGAVEFMLELLGDASAPTNAVRPMSHHDTISSYVDALSQPFTSSHIYREFPEIPRSAIKACIAILVARGILEVTEPGSGRRPSTYQKRNEGAQVPTRH
jgi:hypothetical protein